MIEQETRLEHVENHRTQVRLTMEIRRFRLPPVESALAIGKRAGIGPQAMEKALAEMLPDTFTLITVEHPVIEAVLVRKSHLHRIPADKLLPIILRNCEHLMDDTEMVHFDLDIRVRTTEEIDL